MNLQQILDLVDELVVLFDKDGVIKVANRKLDEWLPCSREDMIGRNVSWLKDMNYVSGLLVIEEMIRTKKSCFKNVVYSNGVMISYTANPVFDDDGELTGGVLTGRDMSYLLRLYNTHLEEQESVFKMGELIGDSIAMEKVKRMIAKAAMTDAPVFICGESGTGKEVVAQSIYRSSRRSDKPMIAINCGAIPRELIESELFGYEEGAFTGAKKGGKKGLLEAANGGTVFLDEIGTLPKYLQTKLLRVLQEKKVTKIGGVKEIDLDIRYISATNLDIDSIRDEEIFRQDLYYRLSVIPIQMPPLRGRAGDAILLANYFLDEFNKKYVKKVKLSEEVKDAIRRDNWPGNVRELRNIIERLVIISDSDQISLQDYDMTRYLDESNSGKDLIDSRYHGLIPLEEAYKKVDRVLIPRAVQRAGSVKHAAKLLGVNRSTLYRKAQAAGMDMDGTDISKMSQK